MNADAPSPTLRRFSWRDALQIGLALTLLAWRISTVSMAQFWEDQALILSLYWIFTVLAGDTRAWKPVTVGVVLLLFAGYSRHQLAWTLDILRLVI